MPRRVFDLLVREVRGEAQRPVVRHPPGWTSPEFAPLTLMSANWLGGNSWLRSPLNAPQADW